MKSFRFLTVFLPLLLTACGLSQQQKADYDSVQRSGVSSAVYDKMLHGDALSLYDIESLSKSGVNDGVILRYLRDHETIYVLNTNDVNSLTKAGVSRSIIDYMLQTPSLYRSAVYPEVDLYYGPAWYGPGWYGPYGPYYGRGPYHRWH